MAKKIVYPVYLYKPTGEVAVCDKEEQVNQNRAKGFILTNRPDNLSFPRVLYNSKGDAQVATNDSELKQWVSKGYTDDFVAPPLPSLGGDGLTVSAQGMNSEVLRAIFAEIGELRNRVNDVEQLVEAQTKPEVDAQVATNDSELKQWVSKGMKQLPAGGLKRL